MIIRDYNLLENITIIINYKCFKHRILEIIINYNCEKIIIIILYNRIFTPKLGCGGGGGGLLSRLKNNAFSTIKNAAKF